jgi:hypothetical protein
MKILRLRKIWCGRDEESKRAGDEAARVGAELANLEQAGYNPLSVDVDYPIRLQNAEAQLQAEQTSSQRQAAIQSGTQQN